MCPIKVKVCDAIMGTGKTSAAINMMNSAVDQKYVFITQLKSEVDRVCEKCAAKHFVQPSDNATSKTEDIRRLFKSGKNIASTHALFMRYDDDILDTIRKQHYVLVLDEVVNVLELMNETTKDIYAMQAANFISVDAETKKVNWIDQDYAGRYEDVRERIDTGCVTCETDRLIVWQMPFELFSAFDDVYVLTYMFNAQLQYYYYLMHQVDIKYIGVQKLDNEQYVFTDAPQDYSHIKIPNINIISDPKLNSIGKRKTALSATWHEENKNRERMQQLRKNISNVFINRWKESSVETRLWTTYSRTQSALSGNGYASKFLAYNARATNDYAKAKYLAYCVNVFYNPSIAQFFAARGYKLDADAHALSDMVQWIWRSAIRNGEEIWIYIPSARMRNLLNEWIDKLNDK